MNREYRKSKSGFTIIELTLAMTAISVLMLILVLSTMQLVSIFNKGITLKRVNQSGRTVGAELQNSLRHANPAQLDVRKSTLSGRVVIDGVCIGNTSYIWNIYVSDPSNPSNQLSTSIRYDDGSRVGLAKVADPSMQVCKNLDDSSYRVPKNASKELIGDGLVVREPTSVALTPGGGGGRLVSVTFTLSTDNIEDIDDSTGRSTCSGGQVHDFCALNTFLVTAYARGGV